MRRGRAPTVIEARVIAGSRRHDRNLPRKFASSSCVDYFRFQPQDSYQTGKSVKAWHPVTLLRICTAVPDFF